MRRKWLTSSQTKLGTISCTYLKAKLQEIKKVVLLRALNRVSVVVGAPLYDCELELLGTPADVTDPAHLPPGAAAGPVRDLLPYARIRAAHLAACRLTRCSTYLLTSLMHTGNLCSIYLYRITILEYFYRRSFNLLFTVRLRLPFYKSDIRF